MDLSRTFGSWFNFARFFGYFPSYGVKDETPVTGFTWFQGVTGVGFTLIFTAGNIGLHSIIWWIIPSDVPSTFNTTIGSRVEVTFNIVDSAVPVITILMNLILYGHVKRLFQTLHDTELLLNTVHVHLEYDHHRLYTRIVMFLVVAMQLIPPALIPIAFSDSQYFMDMLPIVVYMAYRQLSNLSFLGSVLMILVAVFVRFKSINVCLFGNFLRNPGNMPGIRLGGGEDVELGGQDPLVLVTVLSRIHQMMCEAVEQINFAFSFQVRFPSNQTIIHPVLVDVCILNNAW